MPVYAYKGVNQAGRSAKGTISAESPRAARAQMRGQGVFLTELAESTAGSAPVEAKTGKEGGAAFNLHFQLPSRIPPLERAMATRQLATLVAAGVPLVRPGCFVAPSRRASRHNLSRAHHVRAASFRRHRACAL